MTTPVILELEDLRQLLREVLDESRSKKIEITTQPDTLQMEDALLFLKEHGYPISKSQVYRLTMKNEIPSKRLGKRLVFSRNELIQWIETNTLKKVSASETMEKFLAKQAKKRQSC